MKTKVVIGLALLGSVFAISAAPHAKASGPGAVTVMGEIAKNLNQSMTENRYKSDTAAGTTYTSGWVQVECRKFNGDNFGMAQGDPRLYSCTLVTQPQ